MRTFALLALCSGVFARTAPPQDKSRRGSRLLRNSRPPEELSKLRRCRSLEISKFHRSSHLQCRRWAIGQPGQKRRLTSGGRCRFYRGLRAWRGEQGDRMGQGMSAQSVYEVVDDLHLTTCDAPSPNSPIRAVRASNRFRLRWGTRRFRQPNGIWEWNRI